MKTSKKTRSRNNNPRRRRTEVRIRKTANVDSMYHDWCRRGKEARAVIDEREERKRQLRESEMWLPRLIQRVDQYRHRTGTSSGDWIRTLSRDLRSLVHDLHESGSRPRINGVGPMRDFARALLQIISDYPADFESHAFAIGDAFLPNYNPDRDILKILEQPQPSYQDGEDPSYLRHGKSNMWDELLESVGILIRAPDNFDVSKLPGVAKATDTTATTADERPSTFPNPNQSEAITSNENEGEVAVSKKVSTPAATPTPRDAQWNALYHEHTQEMLDALANANLATINQLTDAAQATLGKQGYPASESTVRKAIKLGNLDSTNHRYDSVGATYAIVSYCLTRVGREGRRKARATDRRRPG